MISDRERWAFLCQVADEAERDALRADIEAEALTAVGRGAQVVLARRDDAALARARRDAALALAASFEAGLG